MSESAAARYYGSLVGRWAGTFDVAITDADGLRKATLETSARTQLFVLRKFLAGGTMKTTLEEASDSNGKTFLHTTQMVRWGITFFTSAERIELGDAGVSARLLGAHPIPLRRAVPYEARIEIDARATSATYFIPWHGIEIVQRTRVLPEGLSLTQETPWSKLSVVLRRT